MLASHRLTLHADILSGLRSFGFVLFITEVVINKIRLMEFYEHSEIIGWWLVNCFLWLGVDSWIVFCDWELGLLIRIMRFFAGAQNDKDNRGGC